MQGIDTKLYDWTTAIELSETIEDIRDVGKFILTTFIRPDFNDILQELIYVPSGLFSSNQYVTGNMADWNDFVNEYSKDAYIKFAVFDFANDVDSYLSQLYGTLWVELGEETND